jgi:hypothetical protein
MQVKKPNSPTNDRHGFEQPIAELQTAIRRGQSRLHYTVD